MAQIHLVKSQVMKRGCGELIFQYFLASGEVMQTHNAYTLNHEGYDPIRAKIKKGSMLTSANIHLQISLLW